MAEQWQIRFDGGHQQRYLPDRQAVLRYVLAIGTVEPRKDYPSLVAAFDLVAERHPDVALVVVGADGWGSGAFQAAVDGSPARARIASEATAPTGVATKVSSTSRPSPTASRTFCRCWRKPRRAMTGPRCLFRKPRF